MGGIHSLAVPCRRLTIDCAGRAVLVVVEPPGSDHRANDTDLVPRRLEGRNIVAEEGLKT